MQDVIHRVPTREPSAAVQGLPCSPCRRQDARGGRDGLPGITRALGFMEVSGPSPASGPTWGCFHQCEPCNSALVQLSFAGVRAPRRAPRGWTPWDTAPPALGGRGSVGALLCWAGQGLCSASPAACCPAHTWQIPLAGILPKKMVAIPISYVQHLGCTSRMKDYLSG